MCALSSADGELSVLLGDRELRMPAWLEPAVQSMLEHRDSRYSPGPISRRSRSHRARPPSHRGRIARGRRVIPGRTLLRRVPGAWGGIVRDRFAGQ